MAENIEKMEIDPSDIEAAVDALKAGGIILYPTDTIWGIGCDATNPDAVEKVYELKKRSESKSLVTLVSDMDMIGKYVKVIPEIAINLLEVNDKPMTIIYPGAVNLASNVIAEDGSVGIRVPNNDFCVQLIRKFRKPIVSTSANISGEPAPHIFEEIPIEIIEGVDHVVDPVYEDGATGEASQIIKVGLSSEIEIIRQ